MTTMYLSRAWAVGVVTCIGWILAAGPSLGSEGSSEDATIHSVMRVPAHTIDPALPQVPFLLWIQALAAPKSTIRWEINDCGEATGSVADVGRDLPMCVEVLAPLVHGGTARIWLAVGTQSQGAVGPPGCCYQVLVESADTTRSFHSLSELGTFVDQGGEPYEALKARFEKASKEIARLSPASFPDLPHPVAAWMTERGLTVPQSFCDSLPHNVVHGFLDEDKHEDWVVLCSRDDSSSVVVFWDGSAGRVTEMPRLLDSGFLQGTGGDSIGYSRMVARETPETIRDRYEAWDDVAPAWVEHDGLADVFCEKASQVFYWRHGVLESLLGAD